MITGTANVAVQSDIRGTHVLRSVVRSASQPGVLYDVTVGLDGAYTCTCPAGQHGFVHCRRGVCKHVEAELKRHAAVAHCGEAAKVVRLFTEPAYCRTCGHTHDATVIAHMRSPHRVTWTTICPCGAKSKLTLDSPTAAFVN